MMKRDQNQEHGEYATGAPSKAAIRGHPIHPMLVPLPIGFLVGALLSDLAFWRTGDDFWARAALWLVAAGVVTALLAAVFGLIDFGAIKRARSHAAGWVHVVGNLIAVALSALSWLLRVGDPAAAVIPTGLILSALVAGILLVTGWMGGELSYRYLVGVVTRPAGERMGAGQPASTEGSQKR
jgi:uncharacterized membrane protein